MSLFQTLDQKIRKSPCIHPLIHIRKHKTADVNGNESALYASDRIDQNTPGPNSQC